MHRKDQQEEEQMKDQTTVYTALFPILGAHLNLDMSFPTYGYRNAVPCGMSSYLGTITSSYRRLPVTQVQCKLGHH